MKIEHRFLRSKVARRIFLQFVLCALVPLIVLTVISVNVVDQRLHEQRRDQLRDTSKSAGMDILGRIMIVESELRMMAALADVGGPADTDLPWDSFVERLEERFLGMALVHLEDGRRTLVGEMAFGLVELDRVREQVEAERAWLATVVPDGRAPQVVLAVLVREDWALVGRINPEFLWWGLHEGLSLPRDTRISVVDQNGTLLYPSDGSAPSDDGLTRALALEDRNSDLTWRENGETRLVWPWTMFLGERYHTGNWTVVADGVRGDLMTSLAAVGRLLPLVVVLGLLFAMLLSVIQIRRSLVPLESLQEGTQRIAGQQFEARVDVASGDEFEQLADSFNAMAGRIGRQFKTLKSLGEIHRVILSSMKEEQIIRAVLSRLPEQFECDCVSVTVVDGAQSKQARLYVRWAPDRADEIQLVLDEQELELLAEGRDGALHTSETMPSHLDSLVQSGIERGAIFPIFMQERFVGCLTLGYRTARVHDEEDLAEARRLADQMAVALANARLVEELEQANWETLHAFARAVDANSPWTAGHSERVTNMALRIARQLDLDERQLVIIHRGGLLHDIGKIGVPSEILDKPGRLTPEEMQRMQQHTLIGARILEPISAYSREIPIVRSHHERWDGGGYPDGTAGEQIPYLARVLAVADAFDALASDRPYRSAWSRTKVIDHIRRGSGVHFDPQVVSAFLQIVEKTGVESCVA